VRFACACLLSAYVALTALVVAGVLDGVDRWAIDHIAPGAHLSAQEHTLAESLVPLLGAHWDNGWSIAANLVALPASFLIALALVAWRSRPLAVALVAATAVEIVCKATIDRPELGAFSDAFPSGHTLRSVLLAFAFARPWAVAWAAVSITLIQLAGWHVPTDVAGGVLLGLLGGAAAALGRRRLLRGRPRRA
jgi:membrane-associated phospholipid phosphatase